jgi:hypothetical protein
MSDALLIHLSHGTSHLCVFFPNWVFTLGIADA